ncbi:MAG TPA: Fic family protein [Acetobacteraceae bacterium]|nr:Fic family protein [Acetobacteraceae bacterium]
MNRDQLTHAVRNRLVRLPGPFDAHYGVDVAPPPLALELPASAIGRVHAAASALAALDMAVSSRPSLYHVTRILIRDEATQSSAIEGTQTTLDELLDADAILEEAEQRGEIDAAHNDLHTVRAYAIALEDNLAHPAPIDADAIRQLHRRVFARSEEYADTRKGAPGEWRSRVVWIGAHDIARSTFNPPPPALVPRLVEQHVAWLRQTGEGPAILAPPIRLALAHAHFEAIHPFVDGNGRIGRMLLALMLASDGHVPVPLSRVLEADRRAYYDALRTAQQKLDFVPMALLMCEAIDSSARSAEALDRTLSAMPSGWRTSSRWPGRRLPREDSAANRLLDLLPYHPVVTIGTVARRLAVSRQAANAAVAALLRVGILIERTGQRRNRLFACRESLSAIVGGDA